MAARKIPNWQDNPNNIRNYSAKTTSRSIPGFYGNRTEYTTTIKRGNKTYRGTGNTAKEAYRAGRRSAGLQGG